MCVRIVSVFVSFSFFKFSSNSKVRPVQFMTRKYKAQHVTLNIIVDQTVSQLHILSLSPFQKDYVRV